MPAARMATSDAKPKPQDLAERLADPAFRAQIQEAVAAMPPEKAAELVTMLEQSLRRRKIELVGYLAAVAVLVIGMVVALVLYGGSSDASSLVGWVFLLPLALAGLVMMAVGRLARGVSRKVAPASVPASRTKPP